MNTLKIFFIIPSSFVINMKFICFSVVGMRRGDFHSSNSGRSEERRGWRVEEDSGKREERGGGEEIRDLTGDVSGEGGESEVRGTERTGWR
jgi:hypothetical protein